VLFLLTLIVYANTVALGFALDAVALLKGDPRVRAATAENLGLILRNDYWWPSSVDTLYRPVTTASFLFNYAVLGNGENAAGYHAVNVLMHAINALLVFQLAALIFREKKTAFFAAAVWAVHPIVTESVANIAGRADLLATMFVLCGLWVYTRIAAGPVRRWRWALAGLFVAASLGVFSKESAAVLLGLMLLWDVTFGGGERFRRLAAYGAVALTLALLFLARHWVFSAAPIPEMPFVDNPLRGAGFVVARFTAIKMVGMDLLLLLWPAHLAAERGFDQITLATASDLGAWLALAAIAAILGAVCLRYSKDRLMFWAAGFFGIALLPVSNLVFLSGATMAERFLYLPSIGFAVAAVGLIERLKIARSRTVAVLAGGLIVVLAGRTMARNTDWKDNLTLAQTDAYSAPRSARMQELLASSLFERDPVRNLDGAIRAGETAWEILMPLPPEKMFQQTPARLGSYYRLKGDAVGAPQSRVWYEKSLAVLERAREASQAIERAYDQAQLAHGRPLATRVAYQPLYEDLGLTLMRLGKYPEAAEALRYGREVDPRTPLVYDLLAQAYAAQGDRQRAVVTMLGKALLLGAPAEGLGRITEPDLCAAANDLAPMLRNARLPDAARQFEERAQQQGCGR